MSGTGEKLISIWTWCGALVAAYGVLLTGIGVYYAYHPEVVTATARLNPSLWWGAIMIVSGVALRVVPGLAGRLTGSSREEK